MRFIRLLAILMCPSLTVLAQTTDDDALLLRIMQQSPAKFRYIIAHQKQLEAQIIYTRIDRDANNQPVFKTFYFNVDSTRYFYPASTIKFPLVLLALEKLNELNVPGLDKLTTVFHDSVQAGQRSIRVDRTSEDSLPSIGHYVKKILMVSDNDAFNALYEFMGQKEANVRLHTKGYNIRVTSRLDRPVTIQQNRSTEAIRFVRNGKDIYHQPAAINNDSIKPPRQVLKGKGYIADGKLIRKPFDFTYKNSFPLQEQHEMLKGIIFPDDVSSRRPFNISHQDREWVLRYMSQLPRETLYPPYYKDTSLYDAVVKPLMFGEDHKPLPGNIRIFNKVGAAYGYLVDNAYIVDFDKKIEFMLSVVINVNLDGVYNDNKYEYSTIGYPFLRDIGQAVYQYELKRARNFMPDLSSFRLKYDRE